MFCAVLSKVTVRKVYLTVLVFYFVSVAVYAWKTHIQTVDVAEAGRWHAVAAGPPVYKPLSREELNLRLGEAIRATSGSRVVYTDMLGEGPGGWDADPRYPSGAVNCIIWITEVISEAYGWDFQDKTPIMDRLRYYGGNVGFSLRKHFVTQWLALEPEPFKKMDLSGCAKGSRERVDIDYERFLRFHNYPYPLYRMDERSFEIDYAPADELANCFKTMPDGYYFLFAMATDEYVRKYGRSSGHTGLVHGIILKLEGDPANAVIFHASTVVGKVRKNSFYRYSERMRSLHKGYAVYELDPEWDFTRPMKADADVLALQRYERGIGSKRTGPDF